MTVSSRSVSSRILVVFVSVLMAFGTIATPFSGYTEKSHAASKDPDKPTVVKTWAQLENAVKDGGYIKVTKNLVATGKTIEIDKNVTITGDNKTIFRSSHKEGEKYDDADFSMFTIKKGGNLTLGDGITLSGKTGTCVPDDSENSFKVVYHNGGTGTKAKMTEPEEIAKGTKIVKDPSDIAADWAPEEGLVFKGWKFYGPAGNLNPSEGSALPGADTGWTLQSDKKGTMTLVAQWENPGSGTFNVIWSNGVAGSGRKVIEQKNVAAGTTLVKAPSDLPSGWGPSGYTFAGWRLKGLNPNTGKDDASYKGTWGKKDGNTEFTVPEGVYGTFEIVAQWEKSTAPDPLKSWAAIEAAIAKDGYVYLAEIDKQTGKAKAYWGIDGSKDYDGTGFWANAASDGSVGWNDSWKWTTVKSVVATDGDDVRHLKTLQDHRLVFSGGDKKPHSAIQAYGYNVYPPQPPVNDNSTNWWYKFKIHGATGYILQGANSAGNMLTFMNRAGDGGYGSTTFNYENVNEPSRPMAFFPASAPSGGTTEKYVSSPSDSDTTWTRASADSTAATPYAGADPADFKFVEDAPGQKCDGDEGCKEWTVDEFKSGTESSPRGFFIQVNAGGTATLNGATIESFATKKNGSNEYIKWVAPVAANGEKATFNIEKGKIRKNNVGYNITNGNSKKSANEIKALVEGLPLTNTAGAVIYSAGAEGKIKGDAAGTSSEGTNSNKTIISQNRADTGAISILGSGTNVVMEGGSIDNNAGIHYGGAAYVYDGARLIMSGGEMVNNYAWNKGGAVYVSSEEYGSTKWMKPDSTKKKAEAYFALDGGTLKSNFAVNRGGAIYVESNGVALWSGKITGNDCRSLGGGIYVAGDGIQRMYQLYIPNGCITGNKAVENDERLNYYLAGEPAAGMCDIKNNETKSEENLKGDTKDYNNYAGYGGGLWLCSFGGNATFGYDEKHNSIIDGNTAVDRAGRGGTTAGGNDIKLRPTRPGEGSAINVLNATDENAWHDDLRDQDIVSGQIYTGPLPVTNNSNKNTCDSALTISDNMARVGGGIAANGTVVFGPGNDVYRIHTKLNMSKIWNGVDKSEYKDKDINIKLYIKDEHGQEIELQGYNGTLTGQKTAENEITENTTVWASDEWELSFGLPLVYKDSQGETKPVFTFTDPEDASKELDPSDPENLKKIYGYVKSGDISPSNAKLNIDLVVKESVKDKTASSWDEPEVHSYTFSSEEVKLSSATAHDSKEHQYYDKSNTVVATMETRVLELGFGQDVENKKEDEKPKVEKYVKNKVHHSLSSVDEEFEYSVMAYVRRDATEVTLSDKLQDTLEFVPTSGTSLTEKNVLTGVYVFKDNNHIGNGKDGTVADTSKASSRPGVAAGTRGSGNYDASDYELSLSEDKKTISLKLKNDFLHKGSSDAVFDNAKEGKDLQGVWVMMTFKAKYSTDVIDDIKDKTKGWLEKSDKKYVDADRLEYVLENGELKYDAQEDYYVLRLDDTCYRNKVKTSSNGTSTAHTWVKLSSDDRKVTGFADLADRDIDKTVTAVNGVDTLNGYILEPADTDKGLHQGTANQATYEVKGGHAGTYSSNIVTVEPPVVKTKVEKKWANKDGSTTWPKDSTGANIKVQFRVSYGDKYQDIELTGPGAVATQEFPVESDTDFVVTELTELDSYTAGNAELKDGVWTITNTETDKPIEIEKYVNQAVHQDIFIDQTFTYDIQAYVPKDAETVTITDTLEPYLEFVGNWNNWWVQDLGPSNNHEVAKDVSGKATEFENTATVTLLKQGSTSPKNDGYEVRGIGANVQKSITKVNSDNDTLRVVIPNAGNVGGKSVRGHWVKIRFTAKIKDSYDTIKKLQDAGAYVKIDPAAGDNSREEPNIGNAPVNSAERHEGVANKAKIEVKPLNSAEIKSDTSNTVTVKPKTVKTSVMKLWQNADGTDMSDWPTKDGNPVEVKFNVTYNGVTKQMTVSSSGTHESPEFEAVEGGTFTVTEEAVTGFTSESTAPDNGNVWIFTNKEKPGTPEIEKYVSNAVHDDITIDEEFWFDIHAYVTKDADSVTIEDTLNDYLQFVDMNDNVRVLDLGAGYDAANNHEVAKDVAGADTAHKTDATVMLGNGKENPGNKATVTRLNGDNIQITMDKTVPLVGQDKLTVIIKDAKAYRDHWIKVRFKAKIKEGTTIKDLEENEVYTSVKGDEVNVFDSDRTDPKTGNQPVKDSDPHDGVENHATYKIKVDDDASKYEDKSNTVTVKPTKVRTQVEKKWNNADCTHTWPTRNGKPVEVTFNVTYNGKTEQVKVSSSGAHYSPYFDEVSSGSFTVEEADVPADYTANNEGLKEGVFTVTNTEKPEGPEIEKYVNQAVHQDIKFDQQFTYDIHAYVTNDAKTVTITDKLAPYLKFSTAARQWYVQDLGPYNNHYVANNIDGSAKTNDKTPTVTTLAGTDKPVNGEFNVTGLGAYQDTTVKRAIKKTDVDDDTLEVTITDAGNIDGKGMSVRGHWIKVRFTVEIRDDYRNAEGLARIIADNANYGEVKDSDTESRAEPNKGNDPVDSDEDHTGIKNKASYEIVPVNSADAKADTSNTVTVKPEKTRIWVKKTYATSDEKWPVKFSIKDPAGKVAAEIEITEEEKGKAVSSVELPLLSLPYTVEEQAISGYSQVGNTTGSGTEADPYVFNNQQDEQSPVSIAFKTTKSLKNPAAGLKAGDYSFELYAEDSMEEKDGKLQPKDGAKPIQTKTNDKDGNVLFDAIRYGTGDLTAGTFKYYIVEVKGSDEGVDYDSSVKEITVQLTDDNGSIKATVNGTDYTGLVSAENPNEISVDGFTNNKKLPVSFKKTDLGGKELPGATIKVTGTDYEKEWVSSTEPKVLYLEPGEYKMTEVVAPEGYQKVTTELSFTVGNDGTISLTEVATDPAGRFKKESDGTIVLMDAPYEKPEIEKYVNDENVTATVRDETVHTDLSAFDKTFTYDIQAYITNDASYVIVEDQLKDVLEFAKKDASNFQVFIADAKADGSAPKIGTEEGSPVPAGDYSLAQSDFNSGKLVLKMGDASDTADMIDKQTAYSGKKYNGKWLQIRFNAKIKEDHRSIEKLRSAGANVWTTIESDDPIDTPDSNKNDKYDESKNHEGVVNQAEYTIKRKAGVDVDNKWKYDDKSNVVTVNPETTKLKVEKLWKNADGSTTWPAGKTVTMGIYQTKDGATTPVVGEVVENVYLKTGTAHAVVTLDSSNTSVTVNNLPKLDGVKYTAREMKVGNDQVSNKGYVQGADANEFVGIITGVTQYIVNIVEETLADGSTSVTATNSEPQIEKYVNKDVHADLEAFDEKFTYDIMAYVPKGATKIVISDQLIPQLDLKSDKAAIEASAKAKATNDHKVNGTVDDDTAADDIKSKATATIGTKDADGTLVTVEVDNADHSLDGQWVQVSLEAQITEEAYKDVVAKISGSDVDSADDSINWAKIQANKPVLDGTTPHSGLVNKASYKVSIGNDYDSEPIYTNEVTVKPVKEQLTVNKVWINAKAVDYARYKENNFAEFKNRIKLIQVKGGQETDVTEKAYADKTNKLTVTEKDTGVWQIQWKDLPVLEGVAYKIKEDEIFGFDTTGSPAADGGEIRNEVKVEKTEFSVSKEWAGVKAGEEPKIKVQLYKTLEGSDEKIAVGAPVELDGTVDEHETYAWYCKWTDLPMREGTGEVTYSVDEVDVPEGFTKSISKGPKITMPGSPPIGNYIITNTKPEEPKIEKYVNKNHDDLEEKDRDETVHRDLSFFDEEFTYDIQAYVTEDAKYVRINDQLVEALYLTSNRDDIRIVVKDGKEDGSAPDLTTEGKSLTTVPTITMSSNNKARADVETDEEARNSIVIELGDKTNNDAAVLPEAGRWIQVTFKAKIKDAYRDIKALQNMEDDRVQIWDTITEDAPIDAADISEGGKVEAGGHEGLVNDSDYVIQKVGGKIGNEYDYESSSNTVTVKPGTTKVSVNKKWLVNGEVQKDWPAGASVKATLKARGRFGELKTLDDLGIDRNDGTVTLNNRTRDYTWYNLPVLKGYDYIVEESDFEAEGFKSEGATEKKEDGKGTGEWTITNEKETPEIEKYVNKETTIDPNKDGNVHTDLSFFDEEFTYDIQAYVTKDARFVEVRDQLNKVLRFAGEPQDVVVKVVAGEGQNSKDAPELSEGTRTDLTQGTDYEISQQDWDKNKLVLTMGSEDKDAPVLTNIAGHWIQITFKAKIKDNYRSIQAIEAAGGSIWEKVKEDDPIRAPKTTDEKGDRAAVGENHEGIANETDYIIKKVGGEIGNEWDYRDESNVVTVKPKTTEIKVSKDWMHNGEKASWPEGATVEVKLLTKDKTSGQDVSVEGVSGRTVTLKEGSETATFKDLPVLKNVKYEAKEGEVTNRGKYTIGSVETVTDETTGVITGFKLTNNRNEPGKPEIEKYINENVHEKVTLDETFKYDVIAFVPKNADKIMISDQLNYQLQFRKADKGGPAVKVYVLDEDNHMTSEKAEAEGKTASVAGGTDITDKFTDISNGGSADAKATIFARNNRLEVMIANDIEDFDKNTGVIKYKEGGELLSPYRGNWIRVEFYAQLEDEININGLNTEHIQGAGNDPLIVTDEQADHTGVANRASYTYEVGHTPENETWTNTVTVIPERKNIKISKQTLGGEELNGAVISVSGPGGFYKIWQSTNSGPEVFEVSPGEYTMKEVAAPEGYRKVTTEIKFTVDKDGKITIDEASEKVDGGGRIEVDKTDEGHLILKDMAIPVVEISKQTLGGDELPGAKIEVINEDGQTVDSWTSTDKPRKVRLEPGDYKMKEVVAPDKYRKVTTEIEFTVNEDGSVTLNTATEDVDGGGAVELDGNHLILKDAPKLAVPITKKALGGDELAGAKITVAGADDNTKGFTESWTSTNKPHELWLDPGTYTMKEVVAPKGYERVETTIVFEVKEDGTVEVKSGDVQKNHGIVTPVSLSNGGNGLVLEDAPLPVVEKNVNEKGNITVKNRNQIFTYTIRTEVPYTPYSYFAIVDKVPSVLELVDADPANIYITVKGDNIDRMLTEKEVASMLTIKGNTLTVKPSKAQFQQWGAFKMEVAFRAKFRADADLTPYMETGVENVAAAYVDAISLVSPTDENTAKVMPAEENPVTDNEADAAGGRGSKTGDDSPLTMILLLMIAAMTAAGALGVYRRKLSDR